MCRASASRAAAVRCFCEECGLGQLSARHCDAPSVAMLPLGASETAASELQSDALAPLPLSLAHRVFRLLPVDVRAQAACVCRAWRDALADPALWTRLDLSRDSGVQPRRAESEAVLHGAARRAQGRLAALDVSWHSFSSAALVAVLAANASCLRELRLPTVMARSPGSFLANPESMIEAAALATAAPLLQVVRAAMVNSDWQEAPRIMRSASPYGSLQFEVLFVNFGSTGVRLGGFERVAPFASALADATLRPELCKVILAEADLQQRAACDALVDAALARRLGYLSLFNCAPPAAASLARLLTEGSLRFLYILTSWQLFISVDEAMLVANALRATTSLSVLKLSGRRLSLDTRVAAVLLGALVGHPTVRVLHLNVHELSEPEAFGAILAALVAADAPALQELDISSSSLGDDGLAPLVDALPLNRHLRELDIRGNGMSEAFARDLLLPAVRASTVLRKLDCRDDGADESVQRLAVEAEEVRVFRLLPLDARAQAACVCRAWRDALADPALWTRLDLSRNSGVPLRRAESEAVLHGAARRAQGRLAALDVSWHSFSSAALFAVLAANASCLRELCVPTVLVRSLGSFLPDPDDQMIEAAALATAAPLLQVVQVATVSSDWQEAPRLMRSASPYASLQFEVLVVYFGSSIGARFGGFERIAPFASALADATLHPELSRVILLGADLQQRAACDALVDAALARRLRDLAFIGCASPAAAPLARLLTGGSLSHFCIATSIPLQLFNNNDVDEAALVANALRATTTLTTLLLSGQRPSLDTPVAAVLLGALVRHPTLRALYLNVQQPADPEAFGAALAALVAADAPALQRLDISNSGLGDVGLTPLSHALLLNHHLRELDIRGNGMSEPFARDRLLPAVRANTGLRKLECRDDGAEESVLRLAVEAEEVVNRRSSRD